MQKRGTVKKIDKLDWIDLESDVNESSGRYDHEPLPPNTYTAMEIKARMEKAIGSFLGFNRFYALLKEKKKSGELKAERRAYLVDGKVVSSVWYHVVSK